MLLSVALFLFLQLGTYAQEISEGTARMRERENVDYLNSVKITFLSWLSGSTKISYERAFPEVRQSGEICGMLIVDPASGAMYKIAKEDRVINETLQPTNEQALQVYDINNLPDNISKEDLVRIS